MDLERLKQNLRLRSGRLKKSRRPGGRPDSSVTTQTKVSVPRDKPSTPVQRETRPAKTAPSGPLQEEPSLRNWDTGTALPQITSGVSPSSPKQRPEIHQTATLSDANPDLPKTSSRYGRSGIERPRTSTSSKPAQKPLPVQRTLSDTDAGVAVISDTSDALDFDLRPPPPRQKPPSVESLSESLFSSGYLNILLRRPEYLARFTSFLAKYQPESQPILLRFLETQKAMKAIEYANAVAEGIDPLPPVDQRSGSFRPSTAATVDKAFEEWSASAFRILTDVALPAYITYNLVKVVSDCLIDEITGRQTPLLGDLVVGLSEVFCLTDPSQEDNPIIYASAEFYRFTGYGPDDVIGRNCRFLQGPRTKRESVARLRRSIVEGQGISETLLNYRRDGRPFINLLMIAPLHDDKGNVKYHIGAQADVTGLVERGKGLVGFERYLVTQEIEKREQELNSKIGKEDPVHTQKSRALAKLRELSQTFDLEESAIVRSQSRSASTTRNGEEGSIGSGRRASRRLIADSDPPSENEDERITANDDTWNLGQSGPFGSSGKLPGVYDSYMLIRPAPSLRIVFVSPKLRRRLGDVIQHPFLSHVAAPSRTLAGLKESLGTGVPVSAKIHFMLNRGERRDGTKISADRKPDETGQSRVCWVSATPLLGSDDRIGVWMVVVVDKTKVFAASKLEREAGKNVTEVPISGRTHGAGNSNLSYLNLDIPVHDPPGQRRQSQRDPTPKQDMPAEEMPVKPAKLEQVADQTSTVQSPTSISMGSTLTANQEKERDLPAAQQVEEQRPNGAEEAHADADSDFIPVGTTDARLSDDNVPSPDKDFAVDLPQPQTPEQPERAQHEPDHDGEPEAPTASEVDSALENELAGIKSGLERLSLDSRNMHAAFQNEADLFHGFSDNEDTPRRPEHPSRFESCSHSHSPSQSGSVIVDHSAPISHNGIHYLEYLCHPGSRSSSEYHRGMPGSGILSSIYHPESGEYYSADDGEDFNDDQCARTPYSVD
ncbi:hypothetical protein KCU88_g1660, partial [Aureobasidium melanogenum]